MRVLIVGCGYVGLQVGARLVRAGHRVWGLRRSADDGQLTRAGIAPVAGDITRPDQRGKLSGPFDWVINTISSAKGGAKEYRAVYLEGTKHLIERFTGTVEKYVYTSSTSVYGQTDGSQVDEASITKPSSETGAILVETESLLLDAVSRSRFPAVILRSSGIYGPERGHLFQQYLKGEAVIPGDGQRIINMIHRDDLAGAIIAALEQADPGEVYNATDDEPVSYLQFFKWLSGALGKPMPPFSVEASATGRKRGVTSKRVSNEKLKRVLSYPFQYPTYREGYAAEMVRRQLGRGL